MKVKKITVVAFLLAALFAAAAGLCFSLVKADSPLKMSVGASVYLGEESGLRFDCEVSDYDENADKNYGMLIVPFDYLADAEISEEDISAGNVDYVNVLKNAYEDGKIAYEPIVKENLVPALKDGKYILSHAVRDIYETNYVRRFFGIAFEKTETAEGTATYAYAEYNDNVRSVTETAINALDAYYASPETADTATAENLDTLKNFVKKGFSFVYDTEKCVLGAGDTFVGDSSEITAQLSLVKNGDKEKVSFPTVSWKFASGDESVAKVDEKTGKITPVAFGTAEITASVYDTVTVRGSVKVYADEKQKTLSEQSDKVVFNANGTVSIYSEDLTSGKGSYLAGKRLGYVSFTGEYGVGNFIDLDFTGNNMPIVRMHANNVNGNITDAEGNTGVVAVNGTSRTGNNLIGSAYNSFYIYEKGIYSAKTMEYSTGIGYHWLLNYVESRISMEALDADKEYRYTLGTFYDIDKEVMFSVSLYEKTENGYKLLGNGLAKLNETDADYAPGNIVLLSSANGAEFTTFNVSYPYVKPEEELSLIGHNAFWDEDGNVIADSNNAGSQEAKELDNLPYSYIAYRGNYGVGTYVTTEFTGNQMPVIKLFANSSDGYITKAVKSDNTGIIFINGFVNKTQGSTAHVQQYMRVYYDSISADSNWGTHPARNSGGGVSVNDYQLTAFDMNKLSATAEYRYTVGTFSSEDGLLNIHIKLEEKRDGSFVTIGEFRKNTGKEASSYTAGSVVIAAARAGRQATCFKTTAPEVKTAEELTQIVRGGTNFAKTEETANLFIKPVNARSDGTLHPDDGEAADVSFMSYDKEGGYGVGTYLDFEFTGKNMPIVRFFANTYSGYITTEKDANTKGLVLANGYEQFPKANGLWGAFYGVKEFTSWRWADWVPHGYLDLYGGNLDASTDYKYTVGTYLSENNTVCIEWHLYTKTDGGWVELTQTARESATKLINVDNVYDTKLTVEQAGGNFDSGAIIVLPYMRGNNKNGQNLFKCSGPYVK